LAAILAADIAGYSALMRTNEEATVRDLKAHQAVILPMITEHGGRVIDTAGDGILAEFASVVNAVEYAVAFQKTMAERNANIDPACQMRFRIGINLDDVIHDEARVYGDGVNIAARLETIAEPGGICISGTAYAHVQKKLQFMCTDLGLQSVKNIAEPVRVYRIDPSPVIPATSPASAPLALPDKPSIAVLPFTNLSGDTGQDYLSDGITEDIITELSRFSELFVIARNSTFQYKGKFPDTRRVGRELGVRYVLEGSIRRVGNRVRITGQLIDATNGAHRWAERYDRELDDVFAVQDEVARTIVAILAAHVNKAEAERTLLKPPVVWQAYDLYMRAVATFASFLSSRKTTDLYEVRRLLEDALSSDRSYSRAYALLSRTWMFAYLSALDGNFLNSDALDQSYQLARKSVQLDPNLPLAHAQLGGVLLYKGQHDASVAAFERAITLNPNFNDFPFIATLVYSGAPTRAIEFGETLMRRDPFYPPLAAGWSGFARYFLKQYSQALPLLQECVLRAPDFRAGHTWLAATYAQLGQQKAARAEAAEILRLEPAYTVDGTGRKLGVFKFPEDAEHYFDGLRKAGLPDN
jgi:adenylate cyclase